MTEEKRVVTFIAPLHLKKTGLSRVAEEVLKKTNREKSKFFATWIFSPGYGYLKEKLKLANIKKISFVFKKLVQYLKILFSSNCVVILDIPTLFVNFYIFALGIFKKIRKKIRIIHFIPDLIPYYYPQTYTLITNVDFRIYGFFLKNIPDKYLVNSQSTKNDLKKIWKIPEEKIKTAYHGSFIETQNPRTNFENKKILFVSTIEPRKNLERLINAFLKVQKILPEAELIIVGKVGWKVEKLMEKLEELTKKNKQIKYLGHITDEELINLYRSVDVLVYPSLYEGFGLPPLEAMACGCPVIVSNVASLPEVVGEAGVFVNPYNIEDLVNKILKVLSNKELKICLSKKGVEQAKKFSWDKFVEELLKEVDS